MKKNSTIILLITLIFTLLLSNNLKVNAIPAFPYPIEFVQPDGTKINIILHGDEKVKWAETIDGYSIMFNKTGTYEYAKQDTEGNMIPSGRQAKNKDERSAEDLSFLSNITKGLIYSSSQISIIKSIWKIQQNEVQRAFPTTGNRNLVCILIGFTDLAFTKTQSEFNNLFNQLNYTTDAAFGSVKDYYNECSYGQLSLSVTVAGPYTAANNMAYYGANDVSGNDAAPQTLAAEAVTLANPDVNYANFDNDADGYVDGVYVIYAGYGEEAGASSNAIWAHAWNLSTTLNFDGKNISKYSCSPELRGSSGTGITRIGVICHEFGHVLGAPDFYDTDYSTGGQYDGTGYWDMMASGSWNNSGATPAHHNAYTKTIVYNWATPTLLSSGSIITLNNAEQFTNSFYRYNTSTTNEYFLIENRQQQLFDTYIPGHGMLIYHVDGNYISTASNSINAASHQGMYPICAGATGNPTTTYGTINGTTCPFPGTGLKTSFTDATTPWAKSWASANTSKPITSITENTTNKTVTFTFMGGSSCTAPTTQASNFTVTNLASSSMTIGWTRGNGNNVIVIAKANSSVDSDPVSGTTYIANTIFGSGNQIGTGNFVVYNGSSTSANITGLTQGVTYNFAIYEYATTASCYLIPGLTGNATTPCGIISIFPYTESFASTTIPTCYIQQNTGTGLTDMWTISATNSAGGIANEIKATYQNINPGTSRLILNPINTIGISSLTLNFKHFFDDYGTGCFYKIQTSTDKINWTDAGWTYPSGSGNAGPSSVSLPINQNMNNATTYIAFVLDGNLYYLDYWYIDDINITSTPAITPNLNVSTAALSSFGNVNKNYNSSNQFFGVSGTGLTSYITISAPTSYLVSTNCNTGFASSINIIPTSGTVPYTRVWVKFNPATLGALNGNITIATTGVTSKTVSVSGTCISNAIPTNYYSTATGNGALLKNQLHNIIKTHTKRIITNLWTDFQSTDKKYNGKVWDMYSDKTCDTNYEYTFVTNQCGTITSEGNCFNRVQSIPISWWNNSTTDTMYTDLNTTIPTDGYVNNMKGNYTFGTVSSPNYTSSNGSKRGPCSYSGYNGTQSIVFEPINEYKGDFARMLLYMATRYENRISSWINYNLNAADCFDGTTFPGFKPWQINLLLEWHNNDPVSQKEINRNNAIYSIQGNRNPFIDHPEYAALIWLSAPVVNSLPATNITYNSVSCNGSILSIGSSSITESGIIYSSSPNPVIGGTDVTKVNTNPIIYNGNFSVNITNLNPLSTYYARAYAINSQGTSYGTDIMFTTEAFLPIINTDSIRNITTTTANIYCTLNSNLYSPIQFTAIVYSTTSGQFSGDAGVITATTNPMDTTGNYMITLSNLSPGTTYFIKAYAANLMGESYGNELSFSTLTCVKQSVPYIQNFETSFPPTGWSVVNPDANKTWANKLVAGKQSGSDSAAFIDFYNYSSTYLGQTDDLLSPTFDLSTASNPKLVFNVAYRYYSVTSVDTLRIFYSTDCGTSYNSLPIYVKGGAELSTGGSASTTFTPALNSDWRQEVVNLGFLAGNNVKLKFQAVNDYGNNLYIDDIQIIPDGYMKPTVFTYNATVLNTDTVIIYGRVNANGLPTNLQFDYGQTISYTNSITATPNLVGGDTNINVYQYLVGLPVNSTFHYRISATNSIGTTYGNDVIFNTPCTVFNLPIVENFDNTMRPNCWTVQNTSGLTDKWSISNTANAGGFANELKSTYQTLNGTTRFVSPAFNTLGKNSIKLLFKHYFDDFTTGTNIKIQSSNNGINWTDESFAFASGNGNIGPIDVSLLISNNLNSPTTYLALVVSDSLGKYDYWYIDNIRIEDNPSLPNFIANRTNTCLNDSITFYDTSQGIINSYLWNFGSGAIPQTATGLGPHIVKYSNSGMKNISLTINGQNTIVKSNYITIFENPVGGQVTGSGNVCVGQSTGNLNLINYNGNILKWQKRYNNGAWTDISNTNNTYTEITTTAGSWEYRVEVSNLGCNSIFSNIYTFEVYTLPIVGNISASSTSVCSGGISTLILDSYLGNIQWEQSTSGSGNWTDVLTGIGYNSNNFTTTPVYSSMYYRAKVTLNNCSPVHSNAVYILMNDSPIAGTASSTVSSICNSGTTVLKLNGYSGNIQWQQSNDSLIWSDVISGTGYNSANFTTSTLTQTTYFRAKVNINSCIAYSNSLKILVSPSPIAGTVNVQGTPMCGGNSAILTLNNSSGNIQWIQSSTGTGNWTDVTTGNGYNSIVFTTSNLYSTTYFRARLNSGICGIVYSPISNVYVYPQVIGGTAIANSNVCSGNSTSIILNGSSGTINWQQTNDTTAIWANAIGGNGSNTANYTTPPLTSPVYYRAKLTGTLCPDAYSNIIAININTSSVSGEITSLQQTICEGSSATLNINGYNGNIQWQQSINGIDNWSDLISGTGYNSDSYITNTLSSSSYFRAKVTNGSCSSAFTVPTLINIDLMPVAGSINPLNQNICYGNTANISLTNSFGNIQWQVSDNASNWINVNNGSGATNSNYTTGILQSNKYFRANLSNGVCPSTNSNIATVQISPIPSGGTVSVGNNNFCSGGSSSLNLSNYTGSILWEQSNDSITWANVTGGNGSTNASYTTSSLGQNTYFRAKLSLGSCINYSNTVKINVFPLAVQGTISVSGSPLCAGSNATLTLNNSAGNVQWLQSATGGGNWTNVTSGSGYNSTVLTTSNLLSSTSFRAKLTSGNCPIVYSPISSVVVFPQPIGGNASALNSQLCLGSSTSINLTSYSGNISWEQSNDGTTWTMVNGGSGNSTSIYNTPVLTSKRYYRAKLMSGICEPSYSNIVEILVSSPSISGIASSAEDTLCVNSTTILNLTNYTGTIQWQQSSDGNTWNNLVSGNFNSDSYQTENLNQSTYYRAKVSNGGCNSVYSNNLFIKIFENPIAGNIVLENDTLCYGTMLNTDLMNYQGTIQWQNSFDNTNWSDIFNMNLANLNLLVDSSMYIRAKITNGVCAEVYSPSNLIIIKNQTIAGEVIGSKSICIGNSTSDLILKNYSGSITKWQKSLNNGNWIDINNTDTLYSEIPDSHGIWMYRAVLENQPCPVSYAESAVITVKEIPIAGYVSGDKSICFGSSTDTLKAIGNTINISKWQKRFNDEMWIDIDYQDSTYTEIPNLAGKWNYRIAVSNGVCDTVFSTLATIYVIEAPDGGQITGSKSICYGNSTDTLTLINYNSNIIKWQKRLNSGNWFDLAITIDKYSEFPQETGVWDFRAISYNGVCDTVYSGLATIIVNSLPSIFAGNDTIIYAGEGILLNANGGDSYIWNNNISQNIIFYPDTSADYIVTGIDNNSCSNSDTVSVLVRNKILDLKLFFEGLYIGNNSMHPVMNQAGIANWSNEVADKITVELHNSFAPFDTIYIDTNVFLQTNGIALLRKLPPSLNGDYYIVIKSRNHIETWSGLPVSFLNDTTSYDFSVSSDKAFGDNLKQINSNNPQNIINQNTNNQNDISILKTLNYSPDRFTLLLIPDNNPALLKVIIIDKTTNNTYQKIINKNDYYK